jgi:hypothetical protein
LEHHFANRKLGQFYYGVPWQALLAVGPGDVVTIATDNVGHLGRFLDAKVWTAIQP